jgi:hypothetical protein
MDSSRIWLVADYDEQRRKLSDGDIVELNPKSYSKEFARRLSKEDLEYSMDERVIIGARYIEGIQHLLGERFEPDMRSGDERAIDGLQRVVAQLVR